MDFHVPPTTLADRVRVQRIARRLEAAKFGVSTRNYHRQARLHDMSFVLLLVLSAIGGLLLLAG